MLVGFAILLYSGRYLVKGGVILAKRFDISTLVIGVTVVSFGTSAPELFVSSIAAASGHPEFAIGNVVGSNIANIAFVLALTAIIFPIPVKTNSVKTDAPFMLFISLLLYLLVLDGNLGFIEALVFVLILIAYVFYSIRTGREKATGIKVDLNTPVSKNIGLTIFLILLSSAGLAVGSHLLVENATIIAGAFGISERVIAITVVALGTSLPELTTSAMAAFKKEMDISIGNIIGSNIFNILGVLGISGMIRSIPVSRFFITQDLIWMMGISALLFIFILPFKGGRISRLKGVVLFLVYCVYIYVLFLYKG